MATKIDQQIDAINAARKAAQKRAQNPLTRVKVNSPSMLTKKAPTTRLVKRRKKTERAPKGVYANPRGNWRAVLPMPDDSEPLHALFSYYVQWFNTVSGKWRTVAAFASEDESIKFAKAWAKSARGLSKTIRVATPDR